MSILQEIRTWAGNHLTSVRGIKTSRRILVIESDDWGSIRMPSKQTYINLERLGYKVSQCPFNRFDCIEGNDDLVGLYEVLQKFKDINDHPAIFTFNNNVANPDFERIKASGFQTYHYETFTDTLRRYPNHHQVFELWKEGIEAKLIQPQFHGREHVHVMHWMKDLQANSKYTRDAFEHQMFTITRGTNSSCRAEYLDAFGAYDAEQLEYLKTAISEGVDLFQKLWGFKSRSCIAPCYIWQTAIEPTLKNQGVKYLQSFKGQLSPQFHSEKYSLKRRYTGMKNHLNQIYMVRNVYFEPAVDNERDWVGNALKEIEIAFKWRTPAIICSHRLNYIGQIDPKNQARGLTLLEALLKAVVKRWPNVEFLSSDALGKILEGQKAQQYDD